MLVQGILCFVMMLSSSNELGELPRLQGGVQRFSSFDRDEGDQDFFQLTAGDSLVLADIKGAGTIKRLYIKVDSDDPNHLRTMLLRFYWDDSRDPCVDCPLGDFFALGHGRYSEINSAAMVTGHKRGLTCYFPMPFCKRALMVLVNEGGGIANRVFYQIDYVPGEPAEDAGLFHAHYAQGRMLRSSGNYLVLHAKGRGKYVGTFVSVVLGEDGWFWEGDERFFVDGEDTSSIKGTGLDDYFGGAFGFGPGLTTPYFGTPLAGDAVKGGEFSGYRFHIPDPITFDKELIVAIEHRGQRYLDKRPMYDWASRRDDYYSVAYWYQTHPHYSFTAMPYVADRISGDRLFTVEGEQIEVIESSGDPVRYSVVDGETVMVYNANEEGDSVTLRSYVTATGTYEISGTFLRSRQCGQYQLSVNDALIGELKDFYNGSDGQGRYCRRLDDKVFFGPVQLAGGQVILRFTARGQNELAEGYRLGVESLVLRPVP